MNHHHVANIQHITDAALITSGDTSTELRHAIEAYASELVNPATTKAGDIPAALEAYVRKVALHAYKVTDEDIEALKKAGYSEEALFEITLSAALGSGMARLQRGLAALKGDDE